MRKEPLSIMEQAQLVDDLVARCTMRTSALADFADLTITKEIAEDLAHLAGRLHRMAPFENRIRQMVMKK